jgi:hypothetical protein
MMLVAQSWCQTALEVSWVAARRCRTLSVVESVSGGVRGGVQVAADISTSSGGGDASITGELLSLASGVGSSNIPRDAVQMSSESASDPDDSGVSGSAVSLSLSLATAPRGLVDPCYWQACTPGLLDAGEGVQTALGSRRSDAH